jgi:hypothetical protein
MIVQVIGFTVVFDSSKGILPVTPCIFESDESAVESRGCARACGFMNNPG